MMMALVCVGFASCGDDDDDNGGNGGGNGGGSGAITVNGTTFAISQGYYYVKPVDSLSNYYVQLFNCDYYAALEKRDETMLPDNIVCITIEYKGSKGGSTPIEGEFTEFTVLASSIKKDALISGSDTHGIQYTASASSKYTGGGYANTGVKLSVSKSGDTYTIKSGELNYCNPFAGSDPTLYKGPAFTLISSLTPIPDGYFNSK